MRLMERLHPFRSIAVHCPKHPAQFRRSAIATAASTLFLLPALSSQAAAPGPIAGEFQVNTVTTGNQFQVAIAMDADGDFVVTWQSYVSGNGYDIRAQRYNAAGLAQGAEISVNSTTANAQTDPVVGIDASGNFVIAWQSTINVGFGAEVRAQRYDAAGNALGGEFQVNTVTTASQQNASIALDADGDFVVAWASNDSGNDEIRAQRYNAAGVAQGGEINVNTVIAANQREPVVEIDADGDFVVTWSSNITGLGYEIRAQRFNAAGLPQGGEISVNTVTTGSQRFQSVALDADGDFTIAWVSNSTGNDDVRAQRYSATGLALGGEFGVNTVTTGSQRSPTVAVDADGDVVVAWTSYATGGGEIRAQRYDAAGLAQGVEFQVNTLTANSQSRPAIALDADGDFVVTWDSIIGGGYEVRGQRFQSPDSIDVSLFQSDSADPAPVGSPLSYTLSIGNLQTPAALTGIAAIDDAIGSAIGLRVVDTLPVGSTAVSATGLNWTCTLPAGKVSCSYLLPLLASEEASNITVTLTPPNTPGAVLSNVARVSADQFDANLPNNREVERTQLVCAASVIELSASSFTVAESTASATITATRSGGVCGAAAVQFDTTGSSATPGLDFTDVTGTLSWADGELGDKSFSVPIINDALDEIDERVLIALSGAQGGSLGTRSAARLTITDNDAAPRINFTSSGQTVSENGGLLTVTARLSLKSGRDVTVPLTFAGTASNGVDYFPGGSTLTIAAGEMEASVDVEVVNDSLTEADETAIIGMGTVNGATVGSFNTHTLTILNDDTSTAPTVSFDIASASASEATVSIVRVQLSAASTDTVTAPYTITGNAKLTTDYSLSLPSPIVFNPGEVEKTITLAPLDDSKDESDENAILTLVTPTNATLGAVTVHTRTIVDNDP